MSRYVTVYPENLKNTYQAFDSVDFVMTFENMALLPNSVRIKGDLQIVNPDADVAMDSSVGAHCLFQSIQTSFQSIGNVENFQEYPRYVKMVSDVTMRPDDHNNSEATCELRSPDNSISSLCLQGCASNRSATNSALLPVDFSIRPKFCLNNMSGPLNFSKSGAVRVNVKLARDEAAFFLVNDQTGDIQYKIQNLRLCYLTAAPAKSNKVSMRTKLNIKQSVLSQFANVSTKVPAVCNSVSCSFQPQSDENNKLKNNTKTCVLPNVQELQFLFNDNQDEYVTFVIKDRAELLDRYIESFARSGSNNVSLEKLHHNQSYGIGLNFGQMIDLSNQKFNVQITSDVKNTYPYTLYMYFHSIASV